MEFHLVLETTTIFSFYEKTLTTIKKVYSDNQCFFMCLALHRCASLKRLKKANSALL